AAGRVPALVGGAASVSLDGHMEMLADPAPDPAGLAGRGDFVAVDRPQLATGVVWYRFTVRREAGAPPVWILAFGEPDMDDVRVFVANPAGGYDLQHLGRSVPSSRLGLAARRHLARLTLPEGEPVTVLLRLQSLHKIRFEDAALWRPGALMREEARGAAMLGIQFGILAVLAMVYALFGLWLRDATMLLYALFVGTKVAGGLTHTALVILLFPDLGGDANYLLSGIGLLGGISAFIFLWDGILDLARRFPRIHRVYQAAGAAVALGLLAVFSPVFPAVVLPAQAMMLVASLASMVIAVMLARRDPGDVLLRVYLVAFLPVVAGWAAELGSLLTGRLPPDLGRAIDVGATMTHIAILSLALAWRLRRMQREWMGAEIALAGERLARQRLRTFVDMATHEFKTPLAVIDSAAQMLGHLTTPARPEITGRLANIRAAVQRLVGLIETCLAGERDMAACLQAVSPLALVEEATRRNRHPDRAGIEVTVRDLPETCPADPDLLGIALDALIDNARRYGPPEGAVELAATGGDGAVTFVVADRGPGVPAAEADRVFEKYVRGSTSFGVPGTGLGLHLVRTIAVLHGGQVHCRPRDGGGTCFALSIPSQAAKE
ncbi:MAG: ATP-binding protein, partial [Actinomycetota bacterium]